MRSSCDGSDLCTRNLKIFAHEHSLYTPTQLSAHTTQGDQGPTKGKNLASLTTAGGFTGHPPCQFCQVTYYDSDQLYEHCRDRHEQCFICSRTEGGRHNYFRDYSMLEEHFRMQHYICTAPECLERKFVVFEDEIDLKGHQLDAHGAGDKRALKEARRLATNFHYDAPYAFGARGARHDDRHDRQQAEAGTSSLHGTTRESSNAHATAPSVRPSRLHLTSTSAPDDASQQYVPTY